jgi:hypothetical protein
MPTSNAVLPTMHWSISTIFFIFEVVIAVSQYLNARVAVWVSDGGTAAIVGTPFGHLSRRRRLHPRDTARAEKRVKSPVDRGQPDSTCLPVIRPLTQEVSMKARPLRSRRAKFENLALTWLSLIIGPGLALALSWFGLG